MGGSPQRSARIAAVVSEALRTLSRCAPTALACAPAAFAQAVPATLSAEIPAQPLEQALAAFANQTGLELVYVSGIVRNQKSRAAPAGLSPAEALTRLLRGTGLKFAYLTPHSIRILVATSPALSTLTAAAGESQEVIVTASRRTESIQDVPMSIQVLTGATLGELNARTFDDFVGYLPGVTAHGVGPSQNHILMRGLGGAETGVQGGAFGAVFPSVALYLDEQSDQLPGRNLDVYTADLERIEVLAGPQGTLFGAGAEAGVLRYITNKPKLNVTEGLADAGAAATAHGSASCAVDAVVNLPLITDRLAVRAVIYDDRRGGYIDNIPGLFYRTPSDPIIAQFNGGVVPPNSPVINNSALVANDFNPVTYQGMRVEALYQFNDDWSALIAQSYQSIEADGVFTEMTADAFGQLQPDLSVQLFNPSYDKDRFENTALTVNGHVGSLEMLYAGSYLVRNVEDQHDYTAYSHGGFYADYYQCINFSGYSTYANPKAQCFSPSAYWRDVVRNPHQSHELRLTTPDRRRLRGVAGLFYEDFTIHDQLDFYYRTSPFFTPIAPPTGYYVLNGQVVPPNTGGTFVAGPATSNNPSVRPANDAFFNDVTRGYKQRAAYASFDFGLIPKVLTLTAGTRYYNTSDSEVGSTVYSMGCGPTFTTSPPPDPCININARNLNALHLERSYSGFKSRVSLSWKFTDAALLYYTWSQGYRPGVFNRSYAPPFISPLHYDPTSQAMPGQAQAYAHGGWTPLIALSPDTLTNNEMGWKSRWFDERLQWNGAVYQENWDHVQTAALDPDVIGIALVNGGNYRVQGIETSGVARIGDGFTIDFAAAWNRSELTREAVFLWADGTPIDFSTLQDPRNGRPLSNPAGVLGSPLAGAPSFQANLRVRYDVDVRGFNTFAQLSVGHQSHSLATIDQQTLDAQGNSVYYHLPSFTTYDAAFGVGREAWLVQVYGENLTDTRGELYANYFQYYKGVTVNRPRTIGLRVSYSFRE